MRWCLFDGFVQNYHTQALSYQTDVQNIPEIMHTISALSYIVVIRYQGPLFTNMV